MTTTTAKTRKSANRYLRAALLGTSLSLASLAHLSADELTLTIYNQNLALVVDERDIPFENGRQVVEMPGVSSEIQSPTVTFLADGVSIIEQNFDYDLLSPEKLMEKAVGREVRLVTTNPATGAETSRTVKVLSVNNGVVIQDGSRIEVLRDDGLPTRVIFDKVPDNLRADPTLSITVDSDRASTRPATMTYLTHGLNWKADYVAVFDEAAGRMDLQGWTTLTNTTDTTFSGANVNLIAGDVNYTSNNQNYNYQWQRRYQQQQNANRRGGTEATGEARAGDYYLYPLPGQTDVASNQTKQVGFVDAEGVTASKGYEFRANGLTTIENPKNADVRVAFSNSRAGGLGKALPAGIIRVYIEDTQGRAQFVGEDKIEHAPGGSAMSLKIGEAFDVSVQHRVVETKRISDDVSETTMEYVVRNARPTAEEVKIRQRVWAWNHQLEIMEENLPSTDVAHGLYDWTVPVPAEGEATLTFTIRQSYFWR